MIIYTLNIDNVKLHFIFKQLSVFIGYDSRSFSIALVQKKIDRKRFDHKKIKVNSNCISIVKFDRIIKIMEDKFEISKNWNTKEGIKHIKNMRKDLVSYNEENR
jgi:hypothetical protein